MNVLGGIIFMIVFCGIAGLVIYMALFAKKKEKKEDPTTGTVNTEGQCIDCNGKPIPEKPCVDCDTPQEPSIKISLKPHNPPEIPAGVFCTRTKSIQAVEEIIGSRDCAVIREWYDDGVLRETGTTVLTGFFNTNHKIKYRLTVGSTFFEKEIVIT
jgi:hypothetical protein